MISIESIIYKLDQKLNKLSTNEHQQIPIEDKILWVNEAQIKILISKFDTEDTRRLGMDAFIKRYQDLERLVEPWKKITLSADNNELNQFSGDLKTITPKFMIYIDSYVLSNKDECKDRVLYGNLVKHGDLTTLFRNNHYRPSFEYQDTLVTLSSGKFETYSDGTFTPTVAKVSYLRYPVEVDFAGYTKLDGSASITQDSELPDYMESELVDLTATLIMAVLSQKENNP